MQAVILCGGLGTRLYPTTKKVQKCMVPVNDKPFLDYIIENITEQGIDNIILCIGHLSDQIRDHFAGNPMIRYSIEKEPLGTAGAIRNASSLLDDEFFLLNGDTYINFPLKELSDNFEFCNEIGIMLVYDNHCHKIAPNNVLLDETMIFSYMTHETSYLNGVDAGVGIYSKKILDYIPEGKVSLTDVYYKLVRERQLCGLMTSKRFYDIGTPERLKVFKEYIKCRKN